MNKQMPDIIKNLTASYQRIGGINHLEGSNLPSRSSVIEILHGLRNLLFPGYFEESRITRENVEYLTGERVFSIHKRLATEITKSLCYACKTNEDHCDDLTHCAQKAADISSELLVALPALRETLQLDVAAAFKGDPAAQNLDEVILSYPGLSAVMSYRLANFLYRQQVPLIPRIMAEFIHHETGIDIHPGATIGPSFFIDHGTGVVIGETTIIGRNVKIYQGVTLGALSVRKELVDTKRHPTIEDGVTIYSGATILGGETVIGKGSIIGGNVWLVESTAPNSKIYIKKPDHCHICMNA